jgi:hypothetical protein
MIRRLLSAICLCALAAPAWFQTTPPPDNESLTEKILVVGQRPGPGLWKVSKDDHVLWIFGTYSPLPEKMAWRSREVEAVLGQSQEFIGLPSVDLGVWSQRLNLLTALPFVIGVKKNPDGARLQDLVPGDVYARWTSLKSKYIGSDAGIETDRPMFAAQELFSKALQQSGLGSDRAVISSIPGIAKAKGIKFTPIEVSVQIENPRGAVRDFKKGALDDIDCFTKTIERLEVDIDAMRARANAWAIGDVETIPDLSRPGPGVQVGFSGQYMGALVAGGRFAATASTREVADCGRKGVGGQPVDVCLAAGGADHQPDGTGNGVGGKGLPGRTA